MVKVDKTPKMIMQGVLQATSKQPVNQAAAVRSPLAAGVLSANLSAVVVHNTIYYSGNDRMLWFVIS